jgi:hypothetical protein
VFEPERNSREPVHSIPFATPVGLAEVTGTFVGPTVDGGFSIAGLIGRDARDRRAASIAFERPYRVSGLRTKASKEEQHLERFIADYRVGLGRDPFERWVRGTDPPDFVVWIEGSPVGLDVTQLVIEERVAANATFAQLKTAALLRGPHPFRHLGGQIVYVSLEKARPPGGFESVIDEILDAIQALKAAPFVTDLSAPHASEEVEFRGGVAVAAPLRAAPRDPFYALMRFEIAVSSPGTISGEDAWAMLARLVEQHDSPSINQIVVAFEAPIVSGFAFPSDGLAGTLALERAENEVISTKHITQVFAHYWPTRSIDLILPGEAGFTSLCGEELDERLKPDYRFGD